jgi:hypothetical protein
LSIHIHSHDLNSLDHDLHKFSTESTISTDIYQCDICNLGVNSLIVENTSFETNTFSNNSTLFENQSYLFNSIYSISNKSPPQA